MSRKFLVCTMYCGELDFPHHVEALAAQGVEYEHRVFRDMVEVDAHNAVYQSFNEVGPEWIRVKLDADVVLNPGAFKELENTISPNMWLDPAVHDFFTDQTIHAGVAVYGHAVRFRHQNLTLKCDRDVAVGAHRADGKLVGRHAWYANEWTGFRYGFHRGLKSQLLILKGVQNAYARHGDRVRLMAIRGFELAQSDLYKSYHLGTVPTPMDHNYNSPILRDLYEHYKDASVPLPPRTWR
jgi:hypothetical protein